jgi:hypothetical protein
VSESGARREEIWIDEGRGQGEEVEDTIVRHGEEQGRGYRRAYEVKKVDCSMHYLNSSLRNKLS